MVETHKREQKYHHSFQLSDYGHIQLEEKRKPSLFVSELFQSQSAVLSIDTSYLVGRLLYGLFYQSASSPILCQITLSAISSVDPSNPLGYCFDPPPPDVSNYIRTATSTLSCTSAV